MKVKDFIKQVIIPIVAMVFLVALFYPLCVDNGECDYLKLWILVGIPFGIHKMFFWIIPRGYDIGGTVGMIALNFIVGGLIGGVILIWRLVVAVFYAVKGMGLGIAWIARKTVAR